MIKTILDYLNNHFVISSEVAEVEFDESRLFFSWNRKYLPEQFVMITGSVLNDGVYQIEAIKAGYLDLKEQVLVGEVAEVTISGLAIPRGLIDIITEIQTKMANGDLNDGIASEHLGDYSVSYGSSGSGWQSAYASRLGQYRRPYTDLVGWNYDTGRRQVSNTGR